MDHQIFDGGGGGLGKYKKKFEQIFKLTRKKLAEENYIKKIVQSSKAMPIRFKNILQFNQSEKKSCKSWRGKELHAQKIA